MFYVDNVRLLTGLIEFNFYGLVLRQQREICPLLIERQSSINALNLEDLFLVTRYYLISRDSWLFVIHPSSVAMFTA